MKILPSPIRLVWHASQSVALVNSTRSSETTTSSLIFGREIHLVLGSSIEFRASFLPTKTLDFTDRDSLNTDGVQCLLGFVQFEGLDDRLEFLHGPASRVLDPFSFISPMSSQAQRARGFSLEGPARSCGSGCSRLSLKSRDVSFAKRAEDYYGDWRFSPRLATAT